MHKRRHSREPEENEGIMPVTHFLIANLQIIVSNFKRNLIAARLSNCEKKEGNITDTCRWSFPLVTYAIIRVHQRKSHKRDQRLVKIT